MVLEARVQPQRPSRLAGFTAALLGLAPGIERDLSGVPILDFGGYHGRQGAVEVLGAWVAAGRAEWVVAPGGEGPPAVELGPGCELAPALRRTVFLVGPLDGVSHAGSEAVLAVAGELARERLPADVSVVALPWPLPPAEDEGGTGRAARPARDDDRDGLADEDGPDDLDGDGLVVEMLVESPGGAWTREEGARLVRPAWPGDALRLARVPEGRDDDGDGRFNEDGAAPPAGGTFPIGWSAATARDLPLAEPALRRLADLVFERRTVAVVVFQGNHGGLARPGGSAEVPWNLADDAPWFDRVAAWFGEGTGRSQGRAWSLAEARGGECPGAFVDWCYAVPGVLAVEVAPWGPGVALGEDIGRAGAPPGRRERERLWSRWLDDERAGLGFVPWHVVELPGGRRGWIGGWHPDTVLDPPEDRLAASLDGLAPFIRDLIGGLPELVLTARTERGEEGLSRVRVTVANPGALPTGLSTTGRHPELDGGEVVLELRTAAGARLLSGEPRVVLPALGGEGQSEVVEWLLHAPAGTRVFVRAGSRFCAPVEREVRL